MKDVCGICGAAYVLHEDNDGSYRRLEPHYSMCASAYGRTGPIAHIVEVADDWVRPTEDEFDKAFIATVGFKRLA